MRSRYMIGHLSGIGLAVAAAATLALPHVRLDRERPKRAEEVSPHGPEVSRQVRRKIERQNMKRGTKR